MKGPFADLRRNNSRGRALCLPIQADPGDISGQTFGTGCERRGECVVVGENSECTVVYGSHSWCWVVHESPAANTCLVLSSTPAGLIYSAGASLCLDNLHNFAKPLIAGRSSAYFGSWQDSMSLSFQTVERVRCGRPDLLVQSWLGS